MAITEEMKKMLEVIKEHDYELRNKNSVYGHYFAPDIPDKILKKLIKHYDNHLPVNSIVAVYDTTVFSTWKSGYIFTNDGFYYKYIGKAVYLRYKDITSVYLENNSLVMDVNNYKEPQYKIIDVFNVSELKKILQELIQIDSIHGQSSQKTSGKVSKKIELPGDIQKKCHLIIHGASVAAGGVGTGLAQLPCADNAVITPIQVGMIVSLGKVFDLELTDAAAGVILTSVGAGFVGRAVSQVLVGWIPGVGNAINTATAAGLTEAIGWTVAADFYNKWCDGDARLEGMKSGYAEASDEYESKLKKQAEDFLNQIKNVEREKDEYDKLLDEYEVLIEKLRNENAELEKLSNINSIYEKLKNLVA